MGMFRFASSKSVSLHKLIARTPRQSVYFVLWFYVIVRAVRWQVCSDSLVTITGACETSKSRWSTDTRVWIKIVGITWNCWDKQKLCCIFQLCNRTMRSCNSELLLSLHILLADSQLSLKNKRGVKVGGG